MTFLIALLLAFPQAEISTPRLHARILLPDAAAGYYQATRFDWSGQIESLEWQGHSVFGKWFEKYDAKLHDSILGPVEEFASVGYADAKVGETFVRIGVGKVRKIEEPAYQQFHTYEIVDGGVWSVKRGSDSIEMTHDLAGVYRYTKKLSLKGDSLVIEHTLKNVGAKAIQTNVYNHDFFMLDGQPTGPNFALHFAFEARAVNTIAPLAEMRGNELGYSQELQRGQTVFTPIEGFGATAKDFDIRLENKKSGIGVRETSDRPLAKLVLWSPRTTICPEGFIDLSVDAGQTTKWKISYEFYQPY